MSKRQSVSSIKSSSTGMPGTLTTDWFPMNILDMRLHFWEPGWLRKLSSVLKFLSSNLVYNSVQTADKTVLNRKPDIK